MKINIIYSTICLVLLATFSQAMPPREGLTVPDAVKEAWKRGVDSPRDGLIQKIKAKGGEAKISGSRQYPVILGYFTDVAATNTQAQFQSMLFNVGSGVKSVNNYYRDMSYNAMSCSGKVDAWRTSNNTRSYYGNSNYGLTDGTTKNVYEFIYKVLAHADSSVDFSAAEFDQDEDGYIDVLWVVHVGKGAEETGSTSDIWSHSFYLTGFTGGAYYATADISPYTKKAVRIDKYIIMPERTNYADGSSSTTEQIGAGVFCHEFGHALGLPDLYDTGKYGSSGQGLGNWSVMAGGSWGGNGITNATPVCLDVWCKRFLGWITPFNVTQNGWYSFSATLSDSHRTSARLAKLGSLSATQFWLVEDRRSVATGPVSGVAWDQYIYGSGLAIYHIDSTYTTATHISTNDVNNKYTSSSTLRPYGVALEETDMTSAGYSSELWSNSNYGEAVDMWNSSTQANFDSTGTAYPCTYLNNGSSTTTSGGNSGTAVRKIPAAGKAGDFSKAMLCTLYVIPAGPMGVNLSSFAGQQAADGVFLNWRTESEMGSLNWIVERTKGTSDNYQKIATVAAYGTTNQAHEYYYTDNDPLSAGVYYYRLTQEDETGERSYYGPVEVNYLPALPAAAESWLTPCYPNPVKEGAYMPYNLKTAGWATLTVYNILGNPVRTVVSEWHQAGKYTGYWDGRDNAGRLAAPGVYFYKLASGSYSATGRLTVLR